MKFFLSVRCQNKKLISFIKQSAKPFCEGILFVAIPLKCKQKCPMQRDIFCKFKLVKNKHFLQKISFSDSYLLNIQHARTR